MLETFTYLCLGIGLAAACGFRVFVPLLATGILTRVEFVDVAEEFAWVGSDPAIIVFAVATAFEIGAYYVPWLDNLLDTISVPAAAIAGLLATAAFTGDMHPVLQWTLAAIGGGGTAGTIKLGLSGLRLGSTMLTGGLGNSVVSTLEWVGAACLSLLAFLLPILSGILALVLAVLLVRFGGRFVRNRFQKRKPIETAIAVVPPKVN